MAANSSIRHDGLPATDGENPPVVPEQTRQDDLIRQLAERVRIQRLRQQLRRIRQPAARS
jgi:hypothetical protein